MGEYTDYLNNTALRYENIAVLKTLLTPLKISVIVPCYNVEKRSAGKYLDRCLDSLIRQTFKNFEVICIDDNLKDSATWVINAFSYTDTRFKPFRCDDAVSLNALDEALNIAQGEYIVFINSHDWVQADYLEKLLCAVEKNKCDIAAASVIRKKAFIQRYQVRYTKEKVYSLLEDKIKISACSYVCNKIYKYEKIKNYKFEKNVFFENEPWVLKVLKNTDKLVTVPNVNYFRFSMGNIGKKHYD